MNHYKNMKIESVFANNENIPAKYAVDGDDISPPLTISEIPAGAKTIALIVDDPDAPAKTWVHWVIFNIPVLSNEMKIEEGKKPQGTAGITDFQNLEYGGPAPPSGTHHYFFKVYALDMLLDLKEGSTKEQLEQAMQGHILEKAELIGLYSREN